MLLWRYLTLDAWERLEADARLPLSRLAGFDDAFECSVPLYVWMAGQDRNEDGEIEDREKMGEIYDTAAAQRRGWASCWFGDEHESIAMWKLYVGHADGVAIAVTFSDLLELTPTGAHLNPVQYVRPNDRSTTVDHDRHELWPFYKLWGYRHENEFRIVIPQAHSAVDAPSNPGRWGHLTGTNLREIISLARVFTLKSSDREPLRTRVAEALPSARIGESKAYPTTWRRYGDDWWVDGMEPHPKWTLRMLPGGPVLRSSPGTEDTATD